MFGWRERSLLCGMSKLLIAKLLEGVLWKVMSIIVKVLNVLDGCEYCGNSAGLAGPALLEDFQRATIVFHTEALM